MITKHVDILDRFNRAMPILGIPFFIYQANKHLKMSRRDDVAFVQAMRNLEREPEERLANHNVTQEWFVIIWIASALILAWIVCVGALFKRLDFAFIFPITTIAAMVADYFFGKIALRVFRLREERYARNGA